jgi:hypothetical protein
MVYMRCYNYAFAMVAKYSSTAVAVIMHTLAAAVDSEKCTKVSRAANAS